MSCTDPLNIKYETFFGEIQTGAPGQRGTSDKPEEEEIIWTAKINNLSLMYFT